jgi:hypothetical protein
VCSYIYWMLTYIPSDISPRAVQWNSMVVEEFHSGCTNLHLHQHCKASLFPGIGVNGYHVMIAILTVVKLILSVVLICISFMVKDVKHFFKYSLAICISFKNCLFNSFSHLIIRLWDLLVFSFLSPLYTLVIKTLSDE